ncbi:MAG: hypothetical protein IJ796_00075 [Lachnospiraceae bacterium]|nr:hypothetical protein [Lachnospiraceae bacterium]
MKLKKTLVSVCCTVSLVLTGLSGISLNSFAALPYDLNDPSFDCMWASDPALPESERKLYWYEKGKRQGIYGSPGNVWYDGTERGREIYDPRSDAWYWLDALRPEYDGAKAVNKEVYMPYVFQNDAELRNDQAELAKAAAGSDASSGTQGLTQQVIDAVNNGTGKWVRYNSEGKMIKGWYTEDGSIKADQKGNVYFYDEQTGLMAKGNIVINGVSYHFDERTGVLDGSSGGSETYDTGDLTAIRNAAGQYAIEGDISLNGSGNGYHAKFVFSNGGAASFSFGIQYDVNSGNANARGKCALMIENATPTWQDYKWFDINVGETNGTAHLMLSVDTDAGVAYCYKDGQLIGSFSNENLKVADRNNVGIRAEGAVDDQSTITADFRNVRVKYQYYNGTRITYRGTGKYVSTSNSIVTCNAIQGSGAGADDKWGNKEVYLHSNINGVNKGSNSPGSGDWDVANGVQAYVFYLNGYVSGAFEGGEEEVK